MTALGCCLQHWGDDASPGPQPFASAPPRPFPTMHKMHFFNSTPRASFLPLINDHSSFSHSFIQFLLFNLLITGLSRRKAPSPLHEEQKANQPWHLSQLVPIPLHNPSKTGLCCHTALTQKGPRYLPAASHK